MTMTFDSASAEDACQKIPDTRLIHAFSARWTLSALRQLHSRCDDLSSLAFHCCDPKDEAFIAEQLPQLWTTFSGAQQPTIYCHRTDRASASKMLWQERKSIAERMAGDLELLYPPIFKLKNNSAESLKKPFMRFLVLSIIRRETAGLDAFFDFLSQSENDPVAVDAIIYSRALTAHDVSIIAARYPLLSSWQLVISAEHWEHLVPMCAPYDLMNERDIKKMVSAFPTASINHERNTEYTAFDIIPPKLKRRFLSQLFSIKNTFRPVDPLHHDVVLFSERSVVSIPLMRRMNAIVAKTLAPHIKHLALAYPDSDFEHVKQSLGITADLENATYTFFRRHEAPDKFDYYYRQLFANPKTLIKRLYDASFLRTEDRLNNHNVLCNYIRFTQTLAVSLLAWLEEHSAKCIVGDLGVQYLSLLTILSRWRGQPVHTIGWQAGMAPYQACMDGWDISRAAVSDTHAQAIFKAQGAERLQYLVNGSMEWEESDTPTESDLAMSATYRHYHSQGNVILTLFNQPLITHDLPFLPSQAAYIQDVYQMLGDLLEQHSNLRIIFKPHPADNMMLVERYVPSHPRLEVVQPSTSNDVLFQISDGAISFFSNALVVAAGKGVTTIALHPEASGADYDWFYAFLNDHGGCDFTDLSQARLWFDRFIRDTDFRQTYRVKAQMLKDSVLKEPPSQKLLAYVLQVLNEKAC